MYHRGRKIASKNFFTILPSRDYTSPCVEALLAGCHVMHNDAARPAANTCTQTLLRIEQQFLSLFKKMARCGIRPAPQKGGKEKKERERGRQLRAGGQGGWGGHSRRHHPHRKPAGSDSSPQNVSSTLARWGPHRLRPIVVSIELMD